MPKIKKPKFRSGLEEKVYNDATERGHNIEFEPKDSTLRYVIPSTYLPDIRLGNGVLVEVKGWLRPRDRAKMLRVKKENPNSDIRFVLQRANSKVGKSPNSLMYWEWCEKHGFPWAESTIPEEWFND